MSKDKLLAELESLGVNPTTGRKKRSDAGVPRGPNKVVGKIRSDTGRKRSNYNKTAAFYRKVFQTFINAHTDAEGNDDLTRDYNSIFSLKATHYYKLVTSKDGSSYRTSTKRNNHPEKLRWRWWMAALREARESGDADAIELWTSRITTWYFVKSDELDMWTYDEWAWSYVKAIGGHPNRGSMPQQLLYNDYMAGFYGRPRYDEKGDLIW